VVDSLAIELVLPETVLPALGVMGVVDFDLAPYAELRLCFVVLVKMLLGRGVLELV
jgi:hypothetical protein